MARSKYSIESDVAVGALFGPLSAEQQRTIAEHLGAARNDLKRLAERVGDHFGTPFKDVEMRIWIALDEDAPRYQIPVPKAELIGEVTGDPGDATFALGHITGAAGGIYAEPPWELSSSFLVMCTDIHPVILASSCLHPVVELHTVASTPEDASASLRAHIENVCSSVLAIPRDRLLASRHSQLRDPLYQPSPEMMVIEEMEPFLSSLSPDDRGHFTRYFHVGGATPLPGDRPNHSRLGTLLNEWIDWRRRRRLKS
jgi:hypothetical protein